MVALLATVDEATRDAYLRELKRKTKTSIAVLRNAVKDRARKRAAETVEAAGSGAGEAGDKSLRAIIADIEEQCRKGGDRMPPEDLAELAFEWIREHGGRFLVTRSGHPHFVWAEHVYEMASSDSGQRNLYEGLLFELAGIVPAGTSGTTFHRALRALATRKGGVVERLSWIHTDVTKHRIQAYLGDGRVAVVDPDGVSIQANGEDGVYLRGDDENFDLIRYDETANPRELDDLVDRLITSRLSCEPRFLQIVIGWVFSLFLLSFARTRPIIRFEGRDDSGKTWATTSLSTLVCGHPRASKPTAAALFSISSITPLVTIDNLEAANVTRDLLDFLLISATGGRKEKRRGNSDTGTVAEIPMSLVITNGIDPIAGDLPEIQGRTLVVPFAREWKGEPFSEARVIAELQAARHRIMSAVLKRTSTVLGLIRDGELDRVRAAIRHRIPEHAKSRCGEFFALIYLQRVAAADPESRARMLQHLDDGFVDALVAFDEESADTARESNPIVDLMQALLDTIDADLGDVDEPVGHFGLTVWKSTARDGTTASRLIEVRNATATALLNALRRVGRDWNIPVPFRSAKQFGRRLSMAADELSAAGIDIVVRDEPDARNRTLRTIRTRKSGRCVYSRGGGQVSAADRADDGWSS